MSDPSPFDAIGGNRALDFVNTVANRGNPAKWRDLLASPEDVRGWLAKFGLPADDLVESDVTAARAIRERLHDVFRLPAEGRPVDDAALEAFSRELQTATIQRELRQHGGQVVWAWTPDASAVQRALFPVLIDAVELLLSSDLEKVRECQGPGCGWLFVDRSRGRPRRWCSMSDCGNKAKARRHQGRRADA